MAQNRCTATTKAGKGCRRRPAPGGDRCAVHNGEQLDGLTPKVHERVVQAIRLGLPRELAAEAAGIDERTLYRWLQRAAGDDAPDRFRALAEDVRRGTAQWAARTVHDIQRDDPGGRNRRWLLAVRLPEHFSERRQVEHSGQLEVALAAELDPRKLTDAELDELRRICEKGRPDADS
jgi:hypothetical protein